MPDAAAVSHPENQVFATASDAIAAGVQAQRAGRLADAARALRIACELDPAHPGAFGTLGMVLSGLGQAEVAERAFRQAVDLAPSDPDHHDNLGVFLRLSGRLPEAAKAHETALELNGDHLGARFNLGLAQAGLRQDEQAETNLRRVLDLDPDNVPAMTALGVLLVYQKRHGESLAIAVRAAHLAPEDVEAQRLLGQSLRRQNRYGDSLAPLRKAVTLDPNDANTLSNLAGSLMLMGRTAMAIKTLRRGLDLAPDDLSMAMQLNFCLWFSPETDTAGIAEANKAFDDRHCRPLTRAAPGFLNVRDAERRLRVGYVCADFRFHSNAFAFRGMIDGRDRDRFEAVLYSGDPTVDDTTRSIQSDADLWRDTASLGDEALVELIRRDEVDILLDLSAYTGGNRLTALGRRPAPVQVSWVNPTGLSAMDWLITDAVMVPPPEDGVETGPERPYRLPTGALPFFPPETLPAVGEGPLGHGEGPVFGCYNNILKMNEPLFAVWGRLLATVPDARLILKYTNLDDPVLRSDLRDRFADQGVAPDRIELRGLTRHSEHMRQYGDIDVALDTFPGNGGVTTWEALWMGVPVVTLTAPRPNGRATASILHAIGLDGLIATTPEEYIAKAAGLVADPSGLAKLRAGLRAQAQASPILAGDAYARAVGAGFRHMWRDWCGNGG